MKKIFIAFATLTTIISCTNKTDSSTDYNLTITGNVDGLKQGKLYFQKEIDSVLVTIDSVLVNGDSKFEKKFIKNYKGKNLVSDLHKISLQKH